MPLGLPQRPRIKDGPLTLLPLSLLQLLQWQKRREPPKDAPPAPPSPRLSRIAPAFKETPTLLVPKHVKGLDASALDPRGVFLLTTPRHTYVWQASTFPFRRSEHDSVAHGIEGLWRLACHAVDQVSRVCCSAEAQPLQAHHETLQLQLPGARAANCKISSTCMHHRCAASQDLRPVQGAQSSKELLQAGQEAADAVQCYEGTAAPTDGTLLVAEGSEPAEFAAALQLPHGFAAQPCAAYDSDFAVS